VAAAAVPAVPSLATWRALRGVVMLVVVAEVLVAVARARADSAVAAAVPANIP